MENGKLSLKINSKTVLKSQPTETYEEVKGRQLIEFTSDFLFWKGKVKFSLVSAGFFALFSVLISVNPIFPIYFIITSVSIMVGFLVSAYYRNGYLKMHRNNVRMIESIHRQIDKVIEDFDKDFDDGKFDTKN